MLPVCLFVLINNVDLKNNNWNYRKPFWISRCANSSNKFDSIRYWYTMKLPFSYTHTHIYIYRYEQAPPHRCTSFGRTGDQCPRSPASLVASITVRTTQRMPARAWISFRFFSSLNSHVLMRNTVIVSAHGSTILLLRICQIRRLLSRLWIITICHSWRSLTSLYVSMGSILL